MRARDQPWVARALTVRNRQARAGDNDLIRDREREEQVKRIRYAMEIHGRAHGGFRARAQ